MSDAITPEGDDSTIGDEPTATGHGPEELDDVTNDGSTGDGTLADGPRDASLDDGALDADGTLDADEPQDAVDGILAGHAAGGADPHPDRLGDHEELDASASGRRNIQP